MKMKLKLKFATKDKQKYIYKNRFKNLEIQVRKTARIVTIAVCRGKKLVNMHH